VRRILVLAAASAFIAGCAGALRGSDRPKPPTATSTEDEGPRAKLQGASCKGRGGGSAQNIPDFVDVDVESGRGVDRVTFRFRPNADVDAPLSHYVKFSDQVLTEGEGQPAEVEGKAFVVVVFGAFGVDLSGEEPVEIYTGPTEFTPGFDTVLEVEELGDFEATVTWAIGLARRACFRMQAEADRLILEFPSG
jgi:hypothetical protein